MVNSWSVAVAALILGVSLGFGSAWRHFRGTSVDAEALIYAYSQQSTRSQARLELVDEAIYDFGVMAHRQTLDREFAIKNVGTDTLELRLIGTSCDCTGVEFSHEDVAPGESATINVTWEARQPKVDFRQTATIGTSDPTLTVLTLQVQGQVRQIVRTVPEPFFFLGRFSARSEPTAGLTIFNYRDEKFEILETEFRDESNAEFFDFDWRHLSDDEILAERGAMSGVRVTLDVKPGLSPGIVNQTVRLKTSAEGILPLDLSVRGEVTSDIRFSSRVSRRDNPKVLDLGLVTREKGATAKVWVWTTGQFALQTKLSVTDVQPPDVMNVTITEPVTKGTITRQQLIIEIPSGSQPVNHLGTKQGELASIELSTNHPETPRLQFRVRFAVGE